MAFSWSIVRILCVICCIVVITAYNIDSRSSLDDRNERAVTEWRFRRNHLLNFPYFIRNHLRNNHLANHPNNDRNEIDQIDIKEKKFVLPQLIYARNLGIKK